MPRSRYYVMFPLEPAMPWLTRSFYQRAIGAVLFQHFESAWQDVPIKQFAEAAAARCAVGGRERPAFKKAIAEMVRDGLIVGNQSGTQTRVLYHPDAFREHASQSTSGDGESDPRPTRDQHEVDTRSTRDPTTNEAKCPKSLDSDSQRERELGKEGGTRACAREDPPPPPADESPHRADALAVLRAFAAKTGWLGTLQTTGCLSACVEIASALRDAGWFDVAAGASDLVARWWTPERQQRIRKLHPRRLADDLDELLRERTPVVDDFDARLRRQQEAAAHG